MIKIDKEKIYESNGYKFKNFVMLTLEEKLMILEWRNNDKVRKVMVNKDIIAAADHLRFIEGLRNREDCYYWLVQDNHGNNIGVFDVIHVDQENDVGEIGFYLNPEETGKGFFFVIECEYFIYNTIKLGNNRSTVDVDNKDVLLLNTYLGAVYEGVKEVDGRKYYYNNHSNGQHILSRYKEYNLRDYMVFVKVHRHTIIDELKEKYYV